MQGRGPRPDQAACDPMRPSSDLRMEISTPILGNGNLWVFHVQSSKVWKFMHQTEVFSHVFLDVLSLMRQLCPDGMVCKPFQSSSGSFD